MHVFTKGNGAKVLKENSCSILREIMKSFFFLMKYIYHVKWMVISRISIFKEDFPNTVRLH